MPRPVHVLSIIRSGRQPERRNITARLQVGGSRADDVQLPACPPASMVVIPCPAGAVVEALAPGVRVSGRPMAPGTRRLLRPGERAELHGSALVLEPRGTSAGATRVAAGDLLRGGAAGSPPPAGTHLVVLSGRAAGAWHPLGPEQTLGRGRAATIAIPDPHASRVHARIQVGPGGVTLEDLGSKNGVRVNGVRIDRGPWRIRPRDEIGIGETALAVQDAVPFEDGPPLAGAGQPARRSRTLGHALRLVAAALLALSAAALALAAG